MGHPEWESLGVDFDSAMMVREVVVIAAPRPVFGFCREATHDWVAVHVPELLCALGFGEDIEVVVAGLPELLAVAFQELRAFGFEDVEGCFEGIGFRVRIGAGGRARA